MSDIDDLKAEIHEMRGDTKSLTAEISALTKVMIRKEEADKYLETRVEKLEDKIEEFEARLRKTEDFITKSNPMINVAFKILIPVAAFAMMLWLGLRT